MPQKTSSETQSQARKIASGTQRPGQTKEQTKLIAQGVEKGIAEYKKQEKAKARERDKQRKKEQRQQGSCDSDLEAEPESERASYSWGWLPWSLLVLSWAGFTGYALWIK